MKNILSMDFFTEAIEKALKDGAEKPAAMPQTNVLNAEYALGKYYAIIDIMSQIYDFNIIAGIHEKYRSIINSLTERANTIY